MNKSIINKLFSLLCVSYPIIYTYVTPFSSITFADFFLILMIIFCLLNIKKRKLAISYILLIVILVMILRQAALYLYIRFDFEDCMTFLRIILYFSFVAFFAKSFFDKELGYIYFKKLSVFASIYIIIQYICMKLFHFYLPGTIPFLETSDDIAVFNLKMETTLFDRPRSIFIEPAHFATYVSLFLALYLFKEKKIDYKLVFILTLGLLISGSSTGIIIVAIIYFIYFFKNVSLNKKKIARNLTLIFLLIIVGLTFINSQSFTLFIRRTFETSMAVDGRFSTYSIFSDNSLTLGEKIFGNGIYKTTTFHPAIVRIFMFHGYFGLVLYFLCCVKTFFRVDKCGKIILVLFIAFTFSASILYSRWIILFFPFLMSFLKEKKNENIIFD